ncbi:MAG: nitronate monooxygenase [Flavobacteriales bacterium]|nr:nitronate monooxygenase [Flavobacteriales bacterium]
MCQLLGVSQPVIQGGMVWCTNAALVTAVGRAGGLGTLGSGSMYPEELRAEIASVQEAFDGRFAVNVPLLYPAAEQHMQTIVDAGVPVVITSAGSPKKWTSFLKEHGVTVLHVISSAVFAEKSQAAGVDAVIAEGFEAGGHNGREETTTLCLVPEVVAAVDVPVVAAGGISCGRSMMAAMALGAAGVQMGSRFVATQECPAHDKFKAHVLAAQAGATKLRLKSVTPVRMLDNVSGGFSHLVAEAEARSAGVEELREILGKGRAKQGMRGGDLLEGELEIGQVSARLHDIPSAGEVVRDVVAEFEQVRAALASPSFHW